MDDKNLAVHQQLYYVYFKRNQCSYRQSLFWGFLHIHVQCIEFFSFLVEFSITRAISIIHRSLMPFIKALYIPCIHR